MTRIVLTDHQEVLAAFRNKHLRQALYDAGDVVMADVLVNLHGDDHRARRRLENRLFRRDVHEHHERVLFPEVIATSMAPHLAAGSCELVEVSHQVMMNLAALTAGVDRPEGTVEESLLLHGLMTRFIEGATLAHFTGDHEAKRTEVAEALDTFDRVFLTPSIERRTGLLRDEANGGAAAPADVLTVLLRNEDALHLPHDVLLREVAFFLLAGAHTSATAFVRTLHHLFDWPVQAAGDLLLVQRSVHEAIRLQPSSPIALRIALEDTTLASGRSISAGTEVVLDLLAVNRDPATWGADAEQFCPVRAVPEGRAPWGLSFGSGMHACIGQDLAGGVVWGDSSTDDQHLFGLVSIAVDWMLRHNVRPDPERPPVLDPTSARGYWSSFPALLG